MPPRVAALCSRRPRALARERRNRPPRAARPREMGSTLGAHGTCDSSRDPRLSGRWARSSVPLHTEGAALLADVAGEGCEIDRRPLEPRDDALARHVRIVENRTEAQAA